MDSNKVKSEAFAKSIIGESKLLIDQFIDYHKENGGVSRFVKLEYFFKVLKEQKEYQKELETALKKYSELSYRGLLNCELIPGIEDILRFLFSHNIDCYVISGGEQSEVRSVLKEKKISNFFKDILGSPTTKKKHLKRLRLDNALYFGDAWSDFDAANNFHIDFVYISGASEWKDGVEFCTRNQIVSYKNFKSFKNLK